MSKKAKLIHFQLKKIGDKLVYIDEAKRIRQELLVKSLEEGQIVDVFMDSNINDGTIAQISKSKVSIRAIAKEMGVSFEDAELEVKRKAGWCIKKNLDGEIYIICKSHADASKEELMQLLQTIDEINQFLNIS